MAVRLDEYGRLLPGQTNPDGSPISSEQVSEALQAQLEKIASDKAELERKLSVQGEELSSTRAALNGYQRGVVHDDGGSGSEEDLPDPIEDPKGFQAALDKKLKGMGAKARQEFEALQSAREQARLTREAFFDKYPNLREWDRLVDMVTGQYMQQHGNDSLLTSDPDKFKDNAFEAISSEVIKQLKGIYGKVPTKRGQQAPFFETGGSNAGDRGGAGGGGGGGSDDITTASEAEMHNTELTNYLKEKSAKRNAQK